MKDFKKLLKILLIIYLMCHILLKFKKIEGFEGETCRNKCRIITDDIPCNQEEDCKWSEIGIASCIPEDIYSSPIWTPSSSSDGVITAGLLSCEGVNTPDLIVNPICGADNTLELNDNISSADDLTYQRCIPRKKCVATDPTSDLTIKKGCAIKNDVDCIGECMIEPAGSVCTGENSANSIIPCPEGCSHYPGGFEKQWENDRYGRDDISGIINKKPLCIIKDIDSLIEDVSVTDENFQRGIEGVLCYLPDGDLLTSDICEGRSTGADDQAIRSSHCVWIPPTGSDGTELNTYQCSSADMTSIDVDYIPRKCSTSLSCVDTQDNINSREDNCISQSNCIYSVEGSCFNNSDITQNFTCPEKHVEKINSTSPYFVPFNPTADTLTPVALNQEKLDQCCEAKTGYCVNNLDQTEDIICPGGQIILNPTSDLRSPDPLYDSVQICCKEPGNKDIQFSIKLEGDYTTVNDDRTLFETNFKGDLISILGLNSIKNPETNIDYSIIDISIVNIQSGSITVTFELKDASDIKSTINTLFETSVNFPILGMNSLPSIITITETIETDNENGGFMDGKFMDIEKKYLLLGGGVSLFLSCICCFLLILMMSI